MPLPKRCVEPVHVSRGTVPERLAVPSELEAVTNGTLANTVRQLSSLSKHAEDMFGELTREATNLAERTNVLQARIDRLAIKVTQLDSGVEEVSLQDIQMRKAFRSSRTFQQQLFSRNTMPSAMLATYARCDRPPPLELLNEFRDDGRDARKFYTDPDYFFELWRKEMLQDTERIQHDRGKKVRPPRSNSSADGRGTKRVRAPHSTRERQKEVAVKRGEHIMAPNQLRNYNIDTLQYNKPDPVYQSTNVPDGVYGTSQPRAPSQVARPNSIEIDNSQRQQRITGNGHVFGVGPAVEESPYSSAGSLAGTPRRARPGVPPPAPPAPLSPPHMSPQPAPLVPTPTRSSLPPPPPPPEASSPPPLLNGASPPHRTALDAHLDHMHAVIGMMSHSEPLVSPPPPPARALLVAPARKVKGYNISVVTVNVSWHRDGAPVREDARVWRCGAALMIEHVRPRDAGEYSCGAAAGEGEGGASMGESIQLKVTESMADAEYPQRFIVTPQSETVIEGASVTLDCAAIGNPKPEIVWLFNGTPIDLSSLEAPSVLSCGSLSVLARREAQGEYTCRAIQRRATIDHTATLTVQIPPAVSADPPVLAAGRGAMARLWCRTEGAPPPRLTWLKDGDPLTPNHSDLTLIAGGSLLISGVLPVDAGIFQCMASSPAGNSLASIRLIVTDPPADYQKDVSAVKQQIDPKFFLNSLKTTNNMTSYYQIPKKKPADKQKKTKLDSTQDIFNSLVSSPSVEQDLGEDSDFLGETSSAYTLKPDEEYLDLKNGPSSPDFETNENNHFDDTISTNPMDFDDYDLEFNNSDPILYSSQFHAAKGLDFDKYGNTSLIPAPVDIKAVIVKHRFVTLSWEPVVMEDLAGYAVICRVEGSDRKRIVRVPNSEATVGSLRPNTTYLVSVRTLSSSGASPPSQELSVETPPLPPGGPPPRLTSLVARGPSSLAVTWQPSQMPNGSVYTGEYTIYYTEAGTGLEQVVQVPYAPRSDGSLRHELRSLTPGARYWVGVGAGGRGGGALRAFTLPGGGPPSITLTAKGDTSLLVEWSGTSSPLGYRIRYRAVGRKAETITAPADVSSVELDNLEPGTSYQVRVCALLSNGSGPFSEWVTARTHSAPRYVPAMPPKIHSRAGRDWIYVWWGAESPPEISDGDEAGLGEGRGEGEGEGWQLGWGRGVPDERGERLPAGARGRRITGLEPGSEYVLSLRAANSLGLGPAVYATVRTRAPHDDEDDEYDEGDEGDEEDDDDGDEPPPLIPPVGVKAIMLSATTAVVYWTDPTLPKGQPAIGSRVYVVRWAPPSGPRRLFNATDLNCMIDDLKPYTEYEFAVKMIKGGRSSPWSMVVVNRTLEAPPTAPPAPRASPAARGVELHWAPPTRPNGVITGYVVMYSPVDPPGEWSMTSVASPRARLDRLRPAARYQFKVQAKNSRGLGPFSPLIYYTTPNDTGETGLSPATSAWLWASAGGACCVLGLAAALALSLCCRRPDAPPETSTYQKSSATAALKPPDLWIHHDQMELKHMDKSVHSSAVSAGSADGGLASSSLCLSREYEPPRPPASLDRRHYVPTYVDGIRAPSLASGSDDTAVLRASPASFRCDQCQYNTMGGVGVGSLSSMGNPPALGCASTCDRRVRPHHEQSGLSPACSASLAHLHLHSAAPAPAPAYPGSVPGCGDVYACAARDRERGHYVAYEPLGHYTHRDSLSSDAGPPSTVGGAPLAPPGPPLAPPLGPPAGSLPRRAPPLHSFSDSDHSTPTHSNRSCRESSPYKKSAASSPAHAANRLHLGTSVPHCESELEPLTPSRSTERLQREMQNLEGLMKDLSAITQHQFHC